GRTSPLAGDALGVRGVVTHLDVRGVYLEEPGSDDSDATSDALYVDDAALAATARPGETWAVEGTVAELGNGGWTLTSLTAVTGSRRCGRASLPQTAVRLPLDITARESLEAMRLAPRGHLVLSEVHGQLDREVTVSADDLRYQPTEIAEPGELARRFRASERDRSLVLHLPGPPDPAIGAGTRLEGVAGVLSDGPQGYRLLLAEPPEGVVGGPPAPPPPPPRHALRVVSLNLHNYFNGDGRGGGFPTERGAQSHAEFLDQQSRLVATVRALDPHVLAVQELENDGFGRHSAVQALADALLADTGKPWRVARPEQERAGDDVIAVGLLYRDDQLEAIGPARLVNAGPFLELGRQPLAQRLADRHGDGEWWVVVNHFKSKGSCPESGRDADRDDGQGCWNAARTRAADALMGWVQNLPRERHVRGVLLAGDFNAYRREDPVRRLVRGGYRDAVLRRRGEPLYTFLWRGEAGSLDYLFADRELAEDVLEAGAWHVNAGWPLRPDGSPDWLSASDHDPVYVDLER
ncbi:MAG: ExeM/NucH family extracellular endonuclease, partial [Xanthomonadales bacterium]|nr:ExeM/NucH family extracellular endonuclease [Xanthomonadales bacterium]